MSIRQLLEDDEDNINLSKASNGVVDALNELDDLYTKLDLTFSHLVNHATVLRSLKSHIDKVDSSYKAFERALNELEQKIRQMEVND